MQTGAYINDGIFMNVINGITGIEHCYIYQAFEVIVLFLSGLAFYSSFIDKIKTKRGLLGSLVLIGLYIYGYPYNSWIFGFSYLSVGIAMVAMLVPVVEMLYSKENVSRNIVVPLIVILSTGLIFSYCLFVPAIFAAICIYCFLKDFTQEGKTYLKIFKKTTILITSLLLLVTVAGIGYLFIPTFFIEGQTNLVDALKIDGEIYEERYLNFFAYIPFAIKKYLYPSTFSIFLKLMFELRLIKHLSKYNGAKKEARIKAKELYKFLKTSNYSNKISHLDVLRMIFKFGQVAI
jgi:hypothetical protein